MFEGDVSCWFGGWYAALTSGGYDDKLANGSGGYDMVCEMVEGALRSEANADETSDAALPAARGRCSDDRLLCVVGLDQEGC